MNRRELIAATAAALLLGGHAAAAAEVERVSYTREAYERALASGEPFLLDFFATW